MARTGVDPVVGDILEPESLLELTARCDAVLHLATAIPKDLRDWSADVRVRRDGTRNLLQAAQANHLRCYVQQSVVLVYGEQGDRVVDEETVIQPGDALRHVADMESLVRASALDWCILRGGLFHGPGTGRAEAWRQSVRSDDFRLPGDGTRLMSLVHVADMARAVVRSAELAPPGRIYNIVDDEPVSFRTVFEYLAAREHRPAPRSGGPVALPSLACSNARAKAELDWSPAFPTFRSGLAE